MSVSAPMNHFLVDARSALVQRCGTFLEIIGWARLYSIDPIDPIEKDKETQLKTIELIDFYCEARLETIKLIDLYQVS